MFATVSPRLKYDFDFSFQSKSLNAKPARLISRQTGFNAPAQVDTWDTYLRTLRTATVDAISAKKVAQRDYLNVLAEADTWSRRLEIAQSNDCEDLACKALVRTTALREEARNLKALVEKHSMQVSTLKSQLNYWEDQLVIPKLRTLS